jgi:predicted dehydrogenase
MGQGNGFRQCAGEGAFSVTVDFGAGDSDGLISRDRTGGFPGFVSDGEGGPSFNGGAMGFETPSFRSDGDDFEASIFPSGLSVIHATETPKTDQRKSERGGKWDPGFGGCLSGRALDNMCAMAKPLDVTIVGGGMITNDLLLPSVYQLQRAGVVGAITVCALNVPPLKALKENVELKQAFPGQDFVAQPALSEPADKVFPSLYKEVLAKMPPRQVVVVAMPDHLHYEVVMEALRRDQHILCVKPLVLKHTEAVEVERLALEKGLFVGVEYHKRFDRRSLIARRHYELGQFGKFVMGEAKLIEPWYYRHSNFQNWFTTDRTDPFVYIGCHYVDLVYFITGLKPVEVSVSGVKGRFPNGKEGYLWANGRVRFENGAILSVTNGLGYPDMASGGNEQCLTMFCEGGDRGGIIKHDDQFRGVTHCYLDGSGGKHHHFINPDFFRFVPWEGAGYKPVGYGPDSVAAILGTAHRIEAESTGLAPAAALAKRRELIHEVDRRGIIATPANSAINELVVEAARRSILADGIPVAIHHGDPPHVALRV